MLRTDANDKSCPAGLARAFQICTRTVMDTTDPDIVFDQNGVCNYWHEYQDFKKSLPSTEERDRLYSEVISRVKDAGKNRPYDCILGLSGGVDSSYLAHLVKSVNLRPLVVHFDNGWNNELAVHNIERICTKLELPLQTFVMNWPEFRDLQRAYFKASVLDLEVPTDHMIFGALYKIARQHRIRYIISGNNFATEWLLPRRWYYRKFDLENLLAIHSKFGEIPLKHLPALGLWQNVWYRMANKILDVKLLDLIDYNKQEAKELLMEEYGWRDYGGKHYESIFTRFYQGHILPTKFNIDKRKAHLTNLILSGQMSREDAIVELKAPTYDPVLQQEDKQYVAKKLGFSDSEFDSLLKLPNREHEEFGTDTNSIVRLRNFMWWIRPLTKIIKAAGWRNDK